MEKKFCWEELRYTKSTDSDVRNASGFLIFQFIRRVLRVLLLKNSSTKSRLSIMENILKGKKSSGEGKKHKKQPHDTSNCEGCLEEVCISAKGRESFTDSKPIETDRIFNTDAPLKIIWTLEIYGEIFTS